MRVLLFPFVLSCQPYPHSSSPQFSRHQEGEKVRRIVMKLSLDQRLVIRLNYKRLQLPITWTRNSPRTNIDWHLPIMGKDGKKRLQVFYPYSYIYNYKNICRLFNFLMILPAPMSQLERRVPTPSSWLLPPRKRRRVLTPSSRLLLQKKRRRFWPPLPLERRDSLVIPEEDILTLENYNQNYSKNKNII